MKNKKTILPIRFDGELLVTIEGIAKKLGLPVSTTVKFLLNEILKSEKYKKERKKP